MTKEKTTVEIQSECYREIKKIVAQSSQFQTVSEYVDFVLREILFGDADSGRTEIEDDMIKKRLQSLGYM